MKRFSVGFILLLLSFQVLAQKMTTKAYIESFSSLAVDEMKRSGVPASITLAQGILESSNGNSRLAKEGNNHFGIKCKGSWQGKTIYADDDRPQECFRAYANVYDSYADHSDFLRNNRRYSFLFELKKTDYKNWAKGLKSAGYATNPKYADILISLIERFQLNNFDTDFFSIDSTKKNSNQQNKVGNDLRNIYYSREISLEDLAIKNNLTLRRLYRYNDLPFGSQIKEGSILYLEPKNRRSKAKHHYVGDVESMHEISQKYGIKLKMLYWLNRMRPGTQPSKNARIYLNKRRPKNNRVKPSVPIVTQPNKMAELKSSAKSQSKDTVDRIEKITNTVHVSESKDSLLQKDTHLETHTNHSLHTVQKGETLYGLSKRYGVKVEDILFWNQLEKYELKVGQKLKILKEK